MSENTISNEEIVNDLTEDLEDKLKTEKNENEYPNVINYDQDQNLEDSTNKDPEDNDDEVESNNSENDIDEEKLKQREENLSDEEKKNKKQEAIDLKLVANKEYKDKQYQKSFEIYSSALKTCPIEFKEERAILYANRAACQIYLDKKNSALRDCTKSIELNDKYIRAYLRRAKVLEELDKLDECFNDYKKVVELDPGCAEAILAIKRLEPIIQERNEKLKDEMVGKLMDLGNVLLKPFGLSTNNFKLQQNPETGSYSVNFQQ